MQNSILEMRKSYLVVIAVGLSAIIVTYALLFSVRREREMLESFRTELSEVLMLLKRNLETLPDDHDVDTMLDRAEAALSKKDEDRALAFLNSALAKRPGNQRALDMLLKRAEAGLDEREPEKWSEAAGHLAIYSQAISVARADARSVAEIDALLAREDRVTALADRLAQLPDAIKGTNTQVDGKELEKLLALEQDAKSDTQLRELIIRSERLRDAIITDSVDSPGEESDRRLAAVDSLIDKLSGDLEVLTASRLQKDADQKTRAILQEVDSTRKAVAEIREKKFGKDGHKTTASWQDLGEQLVKAELLLGGASPLSSPTVRAEVQEMSSRLGKESVAVRAGQQSAYNDWAIAQIKVAISEYEKGKGYFNDSEEQFIAALTNSLGKVEPRHLHPAVSALYGEVFQKLLSELDQRQKLRATEGVESTEKRSLLEF